ncbi:hypothetical protein GWI33_000674, partial [Rhynchophorus ferrugineus]
ACFEPGVVAGKPIFPPGEPRRRRKNNGRGSRVARRRGEAPVGHCVSAWLPIPSGIVLGLLIDSEYNS